MAAKNFLDELKYDENGLIAVILQDATTNEVLTLAYMNREALERTLATGKTWFWRRSKQRLMMKGEQSGRVQLVRDLYVDCDKDAVLIKIEQVGGAACHTGHRSCFFYHLTDNQSLEVTEEPLFDPGQVYGSACGDGG
ncbi:MAG TPA: phosphoribosyl-AMP cyclohydrolase [Armatimonadetes bacterium]|nr:phosphoribosyl-AMP cyclohydrolase [Armatimonadota bacterium]